MAGMGRKRLWALFAVVPLLAGVWWSSQFYTAPPPRIRLVVSLSDRELDVVRRDGQLVTTYSIAVGTSRHPTPTGRFWTGDIVWNPSWKPPDVPWARGQKYQPPGAPANPMQGVKIYFRAPDFYIHGTNDPESIGDAASHGCIRMTAEDAMDLARRIEHAGGSVHLTIED